MKVLNFSPDEILDIELKPVTGYTNHYSNRGFVFQWYQEDQATPRMSAKARELMSKNFLGKFTSLRTYSVGSRWYCTEVVSSSNKPSGVIFSMSLNESRTVQLESYVRHLRTSSPMSVLSSFAFNMTPKVNLVPDISGNTNIYSVLPTDRGILLDVSEETTPDGIVVNWKNGFYSVPEEDPAKTVIGRAALTLAGFREE